jgi:lipoprotein-anchoring transpeptidase ErfK/SrfK
LGAFRYKLPRDALGNAAKGLYFISAERWFLRNQGQRMRLSGLLPRPKLAYGLLIVPFLAFALASPAGAETSTTPPSAQTGGNPPSSAEESKSDPAAAKPESGTAAAQPKSDTAPAQAGSQILINIDKSRQEMTVFVDGIEKYTWPVSTGRRGYSTPSGTYTPTSMNEIWYSKQWDNSPMPHSIFFMKDGHAIHGSHEVKNLGKPASHGCVRISPANAAVLYTLVKENGMTNTQVVLAGTTPGGESQVAEQPAYSRDADAWPGQGYYYPPQPQRRGLFGRWFQPDNGPQGYYRQPRGYYPRGY